MTVWAHLALWGGLLLASGLVFVLFIAFDIVTDDVWLWMMGRRRRRRNPPKP